MFSNVKVGDKLWSIQLGECVVADIYEADGCLIKVENMSVGKEIYREDGKLCRRDLFQSLFFSKPFDELPLPPKQYATGTIIRINGADYLLSCVGDKVYSLINLKFGNRWREPEKIDTWKTHLLTESDIDKLVGESYKWEAVKDNGVTKSIPCPSNNHAYWWGGLA